MTNLRALDAFDHPLFGNDAIRPCQFHRHHPALRPEARLLLEVLRSGIIEYRRYSKSPEPWARRLCAEFRAWVIGARAPFTFERCCGELGLEAQAVREHILGQNTP